MLYLLTYVPITSRFMIVIIMILNSLGLDNIHLPLVLWTYNNDTMVFLFFLFLYSLPQYSGEEDLMLDFEVMFDNARYYNEEASQVFQVQSSSYWFFYFKFSLLLLLVESPLLGNSTYFDKWALSANVILPKSWFSFHKRKT